MEKISKFVIILPLVIIVLALVLNLDNKKAAIVADKITPTLVPTIIIQATPEAKLDLQGPWICGYQDKESSISAFISNSRFFAEYKNKTTTQRYLVKDDCYYIWDKFKLLGEKNCGSVKQVLNIANMLLGLNVLDVKDIMSYLPQLGLENKSGATNEAQIQSILNSCKKEKFDEKVFAVPSAVKFSVTSK